MKAKKMGRLWENIKDIIAPSSKVYYTAPPEKPKKKKEPIVQKKGYVFSKRPSDGTGVGP